MACIKGSALLPAVKLVRKFSEKAAPHLGELGKKLIEQRILVGAWYPLEDASEVMTAATKIVGSASLAEGMEFIGADLAENDLRNLYSHYITEGDVSKSLRRSALLWRNYFDMGTVRIEQPDPATRRIITCLEGFQSTIPFCAGIMGMGTVVVRIAGKGAVARTVKLKCTLKGDPHCEFETHWD